MKLTFLMQATSTYFDEDDGWVTIHFPPGFYYIRNLEFFGFKCRQINYKGQWYDLEPNKQEIEYAANETFIPYVPIDFEPEEVIL